jgi:hypothetical protein
LSPVLRELILKIPCEPPARSVHDRGRSAKQRAGGDARDRIPRERHPAQATRGEAAQRGEPLRELIEAQDEEPHEPGSRALDEDLHAERGARGHHLEVVLAPAAGPAEIAIDADAVPDLDRRTIERAIFLGHAQQRAAEPDMARDHVRAEQAADGAMLLDVHGGSRFALVMPAAPRRRRTGLLRERIARPQAAGAPTGAADEGLDGGPQRALEARPRNEREPARVLEHGQVHSVEGASARADPQGGARDQGPGETQPRLEAVKVIDARGHDRRLSGHRWPAWR